MTFKKWSIYLANLDPVVGSEQGKTRPVLIISQDFFNELLNVVNVIPLTTQKKGRLIYPNEVLVKSEFSRLPNTSIALVHQIRTIDKKRLIKELGRLNSEQVKDNIQDAFRFQFGL
ncbi:type II toxin-antitoxin system PemK/MazF family toxin [Algoriphagus boritolerans]|uniref:mRNA interferase n=1 Tax=Algoriphagus boritolerans DSM 17298 = JCM 18970 TaxID=1120964 RepID=A0A1H6AKQ8_9BACT|nr:type II toxin-antitoxin system PemK/MazF family toxin [Algoriphagus boritolerans]SEG49278.1 mRNA interferase MazF [Algoriphagus boritolerans DSM 17298 = JCM 18970]